MTDVLFIISAAALAFGSGLGLKGMIDPEWVGDLVRLQPENGQAEGFAEFRSTFGGMFLGLHLSALGFLVLVKGDVGAAASLVIAAGWMFTALGRFVSYQYDTNTQHGHVVRSLWIEVIIGLAIAAWPITSFIAK